MTNFISVTRAKLDFEKPSVIISYSPVIEIVKKKSIYAMINVKRTIFNLEETEQKVCKIGKMLQLQKAVFKDSNNCIPIKIFDKNVSKNSKTKGYQITNVRASIFQTQRILKATETTEITEDDNCRYNVNEVESSSSFLKKNTKGATVSVNLKSFDKRFICPRCNQEKISDIEIIYCNSCNVMTTTNCCLSKMQIEFLAQDRETQQLLNLKSKFDIFKNGFSKAM